MTDFTCGYVCSLLVWPWPSQNIWTFSFGKMGTTAMSLNCEWVLWNIYPFISEHVSSMCLIEPETWQMLKCLVNNYLNQHKVGRSTVEQKNEHSSWSLNTTYISSAEEFLIRDLPPVISIGSEFRTELFEVTDPTLRSTGFTLFILNHKITLDLTEVKPVPAFKGNT